VPAVMVGVTRVGCNVGLGFRVGAGLGVVVVEEGPVPAPVLPLLPPLLPAQLTFFTFLAQSQTFEAGSKTRPSGQEKWNGCRCPNAHLSCAAIAYIIREVLLERAQQC
jgi:hypothetical protein